MLATMIKFVLVFLETVISLRRASFLQHWHESWSEIYSIIDVKCNERPKFEYGHYAGNSLSNNGKPHQEPFLTFSPPSHVKLPPIKL
jgi:hypothetical protein